MLLRVTMIQIVCIDGRRHVRPAQQGILGQKRGAQTNRTRRQNTILELLRNLAKMWVLRGLGNRDLQHFVFKV